MNRCIFCLSGLIVIALSRRGGAVSSSPAGGTESAPAATEAKAEPAKNDVAASGDPVRAVFDEARQLLSQGNTNAAMDVLEKAFIAPELADSRPTIYQAITAVMLTAGRLDDVKARLTRDLKADPALSESCLDAVRSHYLKQGDRDGALAWVEHLLSLGLEDRMAATLRAWQAEEYLRREDFDRVLALAKAAVKELPGETVSTAVGPVLAQAVKAEHTELAGRLLDLVEAVPDGDPRLVEMARVYRIELAALRGDMTAALDAFGRFLDGGSLPAVRYAFNAILKQARDKEDRAAADSLCMVVLGKRDAPEALRNAAVAAYCGAAAAEQAGEYAARVGKLLELGVSPSTIRAPLVRDYPGVIQSANTNGVRTMIAVAERLAALADDATAKDEYLALALDGYVALDDYRKALAMVDAGFRKDNRAWQAVMVPKLRAHLAMEEGRTEEAIRYFREFMRAAAAAEKAPGGVLLNKTLGMNAARIGDLWRGIGETEKAKAAYGEARQYYTEALEAAPASSEEKKEIEDQLARIAGGASASH